MVCKLASGKQNLSLFIVYNRNAGLMDKTTQGQVFKTHRSQTGKNEFNPIGNTVFGLVLIPFSQGGNSAAVNKNKSVC